MPDEQEWLDRVVGPGPSVLDAIVEEWLADSARVDWVTGGSGDALAAGRRLHDLALNYVLSVAKTLGAASQIARDSGMSVAPPDVLMSRALTKLHEDTREHDAWVQIMEWSSENPYA